MLDHELKEIETMIVATKRKFTRQFKEQAVQLVASGKPVSQVAADLEVRSSVLYRWIQQFSGSSAGTAEAPTDPAGELRRLQRQIAELKMENAILKKAAVILGTNPQSKDER